MKEKIIAIFSTSRAEFGIFKPFLEEIEDDKTMQYDLFAGGTHLDRGFGYTISEANEYKITETFDFFLNEDSERSLTRSMGVESFLLSEIFSKYSFNFVTVLGDRFELLPIINAAIIFRKPIIHIHGGERTEGALDEQVRHMITKAAHIHFCASEDYRKNILRMGEESWRVHNVGALSIDNIRKFSLLTKEELYEDIGLNANKKTVLCTYHPVTNDKQISCSRQVLNLFKALESYDFQVVITVPNIDKDSEEIRRIINEKIKENKKYFYIKHLGIKGYLSLIPHCKFVIGNSSSGILEVPFFRIPTVNIGDRQKGRARHISIIDTDYSVESIKSGIEKALSVDFRSSIKTMKYKFGDGHAAERMVKIIKSIEINEKLMRKKLIFPGDI